MVIIGVVAYFKAANGMVDKFKDTTIETVKMVTKYIDLNYEFIQSEGTKYTIIGTVNMEELKTEVFIFKI